MLLENDKYGQTAQKVKIGQKRQKLLKHTENSLERVFVNKQQNHFLSIKDFLFKLLSSKNASSQLKLAYKHQMQPNSTKTKSQSKTSKTGTKYLKKVMSKFDDLIATKKFVQQQTFYDKIYPKRFNSFKNCIEIIKTAKQHKNRKAVKNLKKRKTY